MRVFLKKVNTVELGKPNRIGQSTQGTKDEEEFGMSRARVPEKEHVEDEEEVHYGAKQKNRNAADVFDENSAKHRANRRKDSIC